MLATTAHLKKLEGSGGHAGSSSRVCAAVLFNPALDMFGLTNPGAGQAVVSFLGGGPEDKPDLYNEASPISHVSKDTAPCLIFHGTSDVVVPHEQSVRFAEALRAVGVPVELVSVEGQPHGFFNRSPFLESTYARLEAWLKRRFGL
jgi:acetyl esterase/lipase